jgi:energy-coupling factor transport system substrate-specific component
MLHSVTDTKRLLGITSAVLAAAALNGVLNWGVEMVGLPIFLDTTFTIVIAALFGWLPGMITGVLSNAVAEVLFGFSGYVIMFAPVNAASGLVIGLMRRTGRFHTVADGILGLIFLSFVNALLGTLIVNFVFGGSTRQAIDMVVTSLVLTGQDIWSAALLTRIPVNLVDKAPGVFLAIFLVRRWAGHRVLTVTGEPAPAQLPEDHASVHPTDHHTDDER